MCDHGIGNRHTLLCQMQSALLKLQITWNQGLCKAQQGIPQMRKIIGADAFLQAQPQHDAFFGITGGFGFYLHRL